jgi:hypothetical protein
VQPWGIPHRVARLLLRFDDALDHNAVVADIKSRH